MNRVASCISVCAFTCFASPLSAAPADLVAKFSCDGEWKIYEGTTPGTYKLRGIYVEVRGHQLRVNGAGSFDDAYQEMRSDERLMFFRHPSDSLFEGNLNRINGDFWLVRWVDERKTKAASSISAECRPYKPLF